MTKQYLCIKDEDVEKFVEELFYVLNHSNTSVGYTSTGQEIHTDFGYVEDFITDILNCITTKGDECNE